MKKFFGLLAIVAAVALAGCSCGGTDTGSSSSGTPSYIKSDDLGFEPISASSDKPDVAEASVEDEARAASSKVVKVTPMGDGTAIVTVVGADGKTKKFKVVVSKELKCTITPISDDDSGSSGAGKYKCSVCSFEYETEAEAKACKKTAACPGNSSQADPVCYDSTKLTADDLTTIAVEAWASKLYNFPVANEMTTKELSNNVVVGWKGSKVGVLRFRAETEGAANITSLNYNGGLGNEGDIAAKGSKITAIVDRYVGVKTEASTAYTYKLTGYVTGIEKTQAAKNNALVDTASLTGKIALVAADGTVLAVHEIELNKGAAAWKSGNQDFTGSITTTDTEVRVVFSREGAQKYTSSNSTYGGSGGFDVVKLELTPAN